MSSEVTLSSSKKKSYNIQFKLDAINNAETHGNHGTAKKFGVAVKRIRQWRKQKEELEKTKEKSQGSKRMRLDGGGRKPSLAELEEDLMEWVLKRRKKREEAKDYMSREL